MAVSIDWPKSSTPSDWSMFDAGILAQQVTVGGLRDSHVDKGKLSCHEHQVQGCICSHACQPSLVRILSRRLDMEGRLWVQRTTSIDAAIAVVNSQNLHWRRVLNLEQAPLRARLLAPSYFPSIVEAIVHKQARSRTGGISGTLRDKRSMPP